MHQEPCPPSLLLGSTGLESHDKDSSTDNTESGTLKVTEPDSLKAASQTSPVSSKDNNVKTLSICAQLSSSSQQSTDLRLLATRLGSQGSLVSVSESDREDQNDSSQDSLGEVEMMIKQVSVKNLAGEADFLSPSSPPKCKVLFEGSVTNKPVSSDVVVIPRSKTPFQGLTSCCGDLGTKLNPVTPTKPVSETIDPLTPTANLKMLSSVASPEIRNREKLKAITHKIIKEEEVASSPEEATETNGKAAKRPKSSVRQSDDDQDFNLEDSDCIDGVSQHVISRKQKSLGLLCQRFLARYPEYPALFDTIEICLDEVAKDLNVERRRIYDIVNVLESVEIVSRMAKNKYVWHGKNNLSHTLSKLKALAKMEGFAEQIERIKDYEVSRELDGGGSVNKGKKMKKICAASYVPSVVSPRKKEPLKTSDQSNIQDIPTAVDTVRKEKSLGIMSQKFLMLFLVSQPKTVNLDISAKILIGNPNVDRTENGKFKTKIRRLYDIANILTSLDLIRKVHVTEVRGRKPAFKYVGPNVEDIKEVEVCSADGNHRPMSKHSLLDSIQSQQVCSILSNQQCFKPISRHSLLSQPIQDFGLSDRRGHRRMTSHSAMSKFSRHASFEQICEVAEQERNRLYFESRSQPSSPTIKRQPILPRFQSTNRGGSMSTLLSNASSLKHLMVIRGARVSEGNPAEGSTSMSEVEADMRYTLVQKYPIQTVTLTPIAQMQSGKTDGARMEQADSMKETEPRMLIKAQLSQPDATKQPMIVTLTKDQLDAVIRSLSTSSGASTTDTDVVDEAMANAKYVDASTQSSPQMPNGIVNLMKKLDEAPSKQGQLMLLGGAGGAMQGAPVGGTPCVKIIHLDCSSAATTVTNSNKTTLADNHKRPLASTDAATQVKRQRTEAFPPVTAVGVVAPVEIARPASGVEMTSLLNTQDAEVATITQMAVMPGAATPVAELVPSPLKAVHVESDYHNMASPLIHHPIYPPSPPKVTLIGYDLASPLLHSFNEEISPVSQLNTPPIDYILQQPLEETSVQSSAPFIFQFPASSTGVATPGASMQPTLAPGPPMQPTLATGPSQCSQANTPTFRLSSTCSPIMLLQSRHSDSLTDDTRLPATPLQQYLSSLQPLIKSRPPPMNARALVGNSGSIIQSTVGYSLSGISPSTKISPLHSMSGALGHAVFSTPKASPANILPTGGFQSGSSRPPGGYTPTSGNIVNLVPLFSSSPQGGNLKVINHAGNQMHAGGSMHRLQKPIPVSLESSFSLLSQSASVKVDASGMNRGEYVMRTPRSFSQELMSPSQNMCTPTSNVVLGNKVAATPNTFFRSTPGGMVSTAAYSQHMLLNQNSAFQCVSPFQPVSGGVSTARRLTMTHFDPQP